jgi:hypothetical protein
MNESRVLHSFVAAVGLFFFLCMTASAQVCEPDGFATGASLTNACAGVTLLVEQRSDTVVAEIPGVTTATSTGTKVFGQTLDDFGWGASDATPETLRGNFVSPVRSVSIDLISNDTPDAGFLRVYNSSDVLLAEVLSPVLALNQVFTATVSRPNADIAYFRASGINGDNLNLDNLRYAVPEPGSVGLLAGVLGFLGRRRAPKAM